MEEEHRCHTVAVYAPKGEGLSLGKRKQSEYKDEEQQQYACRTDEALLLAYGAEDEVGVFFGHEVVFDLRSLQEPLAEEAARADGDEGLQNVEALAERVRGRIEKRQHALTLVVVHQAPDDGHRQDKDAREGNKDALAQACEEDDGCARDEHEDRGAEVGLLHDEADGDGHDDEGRQMVPVADVLPSDVVVPGEHHGDRKLHELRGLDAHADVCLLYTSDAADE